jgi:hypothetical protein
MILGLRVLVSLPVRCRPLPRRCDRLRLRVRRTRASVVLHRVVFGRGPSLLSRAKIHILVCDVSNLAILDHQPGFRTLAPGVRLPLRVKLLLGVFAPSKRIP